MIYTQPEIKKILSDLVAKGAETDIILSSLIDIIAENETIDRDSFTRLLVQIVPDRFTAFTAIKTFTDAATLVALSSAKSDRLFNCYKVMQEELLKIFITNLLATVQTDADFKLAHGPELRRLLSGETVGSDIDPQVLALVKQHLKL